MSDAEQTREMWITGQASADVDAVVERLSARTTAVPDSPGSGAGGDSKNVQEAPMPLYIVKGNCTVRMARILMSEEAPMRGFWWSCTYIKKFDFSLVEFQCSRVRHNIDVSTLFKNEDWALVQYNQDTTVNMDDLKFLDQEFGTLSSSPEFEVRS